MNKGTIPALLSVFLYASLLPQAWAQEKVSNIRTGSRDVSLSGNLTYASRSNSSGQAAVQFGYFSTPQVEYGFSIGASFRSDPADVRPVAGGGTAIIGSSFTTGGQIGTLVRYHFGQQQIVPYVGLYPNYGLTNVRGNKGSVFILIGALGADYFVHPRQTVFAEVSAVRSLGSGSSTTGELNFGIRFFY